jgi:hypothetical protein
MTAALKALEDECYSLMRGRRRGFSCPLFLSLFDRWQAMQQGLPPVAGGYQDQNPHLLQAFRALDRARSWAEHDNNRR